MKTLNLHKEIKDFNGKPISSQNGTMVMKDLYLHYLGLFTSQNGKDVINAYKLGVIIADCKKDTLEIENADFLLIKQATQKPQHGALAMGQLYEELEQIEKEPDSKKKDKPK